MARFKEKVLLESTKLRKQGAPSVATIVSSAAGGHFVNSDPLVRRGERGRGGGAIQVHDSPLIMKLTK